VGRWNNSNNKKTLRQYTPQSFNRVGVYLRQPVEQPTEQPTEQPVEHPTEHPVEQPKLRAPRASIPRPERLVATLLDLTVKSPVVAYETCAAGELNEADDCLLLSGEEMIFAEAKTDNVMKRMAISLVFILFTHTQLQLRRNLFFENTFAIWTPKTS
jgi:hypothetical protein